MLYVENLDTSFRSTNQFDGSLVFVRTHAPCELCGEAEALNGMCDWMQIKHLPARFTGGPRTW